MDRLVQQKRSLPAIERKEVEVGDVIRGRVRSLTAYGAFLSIPGGQQGLLHNTELAHEHVAHPGQHLKVGDEIEVKVIEVEKREDGKLRLGFSRKAILPVPEGGVAPAPRAEQGEQRNRPRRDDNRPRQGGGGNAGNAGNAGNRGDNKGGRSDARNEQRSQAKSNDNRNDNRGEKRGEGKPRNDRGGNKGGNRGHQDQPKDSPMGSLGELLLHKLEEAKKDK
jgi:predicted RNA-binding protein with RPS1 domain